MDIGLLQQALENEDNLSIIETNIEELKAKKNDILQQLGLKKDNLKEFHSKLKHYRYIEDIKGLRYGGVLRWINLNKTDDIKLNNCGILCDIKAMKKGIGLVMRNYNNRFFTLYLTENLLFQKINMEEEIILKAIKHMSK